MVRISRQCDRGEHRAVDPEDLPGCVSLGCRCDCHPRPGKASDRPGLRYRVQIVPDAVTPY